MRTEIVIISPSELFEAYVQEVLTENLLNIPSYITTGQDTLDLVATLINNGTKIIITRGRNVNLIRENFSIPVVDIRYTYEDIHYTYEAAKKLSDKIAFMGFDLAYITACRFQKIAGVPLRIPCLTRISMMDETVKNLAEQGIEVVIGGNTTKIACRKYGLTCIETIVSKNSIQIATDEALHLYYIDRERKRNSSMVNAILESTNSGIIALDEKQRLLFINERAKSFLHNEVNGFIRRLMETEEIAVSIKDNHKISNYTVFSESGNLTFDCRPILANDTSLGCVITIRRTDHILSAEKTIRKSLVSHSYSAKKTFADIIGKSDAINSLMIQAKKYAKSDSTILITGASGTGKEIFAQSIHNFSNRKEEPFVAINCAAIPENILESELFGYVKGAFTGAKNEGKMGLFELAHHGTIFLDEIGELSKQAQVKLLRVLQEREVTRIGDVKTISVNVRVIAATNQNLMEQIRKNEFREDLFYRLSVLRLALPPLRERKSDIETLVHAIISDYGKPIIISEAGIQLLMCYDFPGNIRQLQNVMERLVVMCENNKIDRPLVLSILKDEPGFLAGGSVENQYLPDNTYKTVFQQEKQLILNTLEKNGGNKLLTAKELDISKSTLWRKLKQYDV